MPTSSEEKYPLLLLLMEDGKGGKPQKRFFVEKNRSAGITTGATAVITQWPGHVTSCWVTSLMCLLTIFLLGMMMFAISIHPHRHYIKTRCVMSAEDERMNNRTIHLVHDDGVWHESQLRVLEQIVSGEYPNCTVHLITIRSGGELFLRRMIEGLDATTVVFKNASAGSTATVEGFKVGRGRAKRFLLNRMLRRRKRTTQAGAKLSTATSTGENIELDINVGTKKILNVLLKQRQQTREESLVGEQPNPTTGDVAGIEDILARHPEVIRTNATYDEVFQNSPLHYTWRKLSEKLRIFAVRVLYLWQYGGISIDLPEIDEASENLTQYKYRTLEVESNSSISVEEDKGEDYPARLKKVLGFVAKAIRSFETINQGAVTVDEYGLHMETKASCHAFFGEMLYNLKRADAKTTVADVMRETLKVFCKSGAVDSGYCDGGGGRR